MIAKDIMTKAPKFLPPTATLQEAAQIMKSQDFGFIPVGENDRLIGAVTDRDIILRGVAAGKDPTKTTLKEVMSTGIEYCLESDELEKLIGHMEDSKIRRLVVLNKDKRMTGIISLGDIATKGHNAKLCSELTEAVSE